MFCSCFRVGGFPARGRGGEWAQCTGRGRPKYYLEAVLIVNFCKAYIAVFLMMVGGR